MRTIRLDTFQGTARVLGRDCAVALGAGVLGITATRPATPAPDSKLEPDPEFAMRVLEALDAPGSQPDGHPAAKAPLAVIRREGGDWIFEATEFGEDPGTTVVRASSAGALFAALAARYSPKESVSVVAQADFSQKPEPQTSPKAESVAPAAAEQAASPPPARRPRKPPIPLAAPAPAPIIPTEPPPPPPPAEVKASPTPSARPAPPALHLVAPLDEDEEDGPESAGGCPNDADGPVADLIPVSEALAKAAKLREVVSFLMERGRTTAEQIEAACAALKALKPCPVPVLDRLPAENLHDRLGNVFTILNIGQAS